MRNYLALALATAVIVAAQADESPTRAAQSDTRVALGPNDRVTVTYQRSRNYRCAVGTLVVQEWGSRVRLSCSDQVALSDKDRPSATVHATE